uniref:Uncharacterized protein n=1 Tax=Anguilla anguilla TaxID=7936 RepID=A0A0E9QLC3_ANGAN
MRESRIYFAKLQLWDKLSTVGTAISDGTSEPCNPQCWRFARVLACSVLQSE